MNQTASIFSRAKTTLRRGFARSKQVASDFIGRRPFLSFILALVALIGLIAASNYLARPPADTNNQAEAPKAVATFKVGTDSAIDAQAQVKKTGVATVVAQSGGVIQKVYKKEGQRVGRGSTLAWIATNYSGGTLSSAQRKQAQTNYEFARDNLDANKAVIAQQRLVAELNRENTDQLRQISEKSVQETKDLISLNNDLMNRINQSITTLQQNATPSASESASLTSALSQKAQLQSGLNQLNSALRSTEYQTDTSKPPTELANTQKDLTLKQLDLQEKSLELQEKVGKLTLQVAQIAESLNYPASPFTGVVEKINVVPGQTVSPGEVIAVVTADQTSATAEVLVPRSIAHQVSTSKPSTLTIGDQQLELLPSYISTQPTSGTLFTVKFSMPAAQVAAVSNAVYLPIRIPLGPDVQTTDSQLHVPLDAIYESQDGAYVYIIVTDSGVTKAAVRKLELGEVVGSYVAVKNGLQNGDVVILDRTILDGEVVTIE